ncbi:hypothetical protein FQR65_LT01555 [Abscondita terminalis]|nr:hypothetical protein FQR65_LT01555 [Abscondita terminalis]
MWILATIVLIVTYALYKYVKFYKYWDEKGVPNDKPFFFLGNLALNVFRIKTMQQIIIDSYKKFSKHRYIGFYSFNDEVLIVKDLELIKQIMVKDFDVFPDHKTFIPPNTDPLWEKNLFQLKAEDGWHDMRTTLSPSFTSNKLKTMFVLMQDCSKRFVENFKSQNTTVSLNVKDAFTKFANDIIGTAAFGITCDSIKNPTNEFYVMGKEATDFSGLKAFRFFGYAISPTIMKLFGVPIFNSRVRNFFNRIIKETVDYRKEKNIVRPDMINLMLQAQKAQENHESKKSIDLTYESMTAQALIFFTAGFETISTAMTYLMYDLAVNRDVQEKLYSEINEALPGGQEASYEVLSAMKYLDCVVSESLRFHTPIPFLDRKAVKPYTIEPVMPWEKPLHLEKGSLIWVPVEALQHDEAYFPNPEKFDPERFNSENKAEINPFTYLPFGSGPRICIGSRFALLEIKMLFVDLLQHFEIVTNEKTQIPLKPSKANFNLIPNEGIWVSFKPRKL